MTFQPEQIERLSNNFSTLAPQLDQLVDVFYQRLFETAPSVRELFPEDMKGQKKHMIGALQLVAKNIGNLDNLREPLLKMGETHIGYGAQEAHYPVVRDTMVAALAEISDYTWTPTLEDDWKQALNTIAGYMIEGARAAESKAA